jgi:mannose-6-phosphate isomerase-like protein (cupin superfamily)
MTNDHTMSYPKITHVKAGEGERLEAGGISCQFKITTDVTCQQFGIYELTLKPFTAGAGFHFHRSLDETFMVKSGAITIRTPEETIVATAGSMVYIPRRTPHAFSNDSSDVAVVLLSFTPGKGREDYFRGLFHAISTNGLSGGAFRELYEKFDNVSFPEQQR